MTLAAGTRLGPYEIQAPLGAGGMGEVYRATDTRLGRDVAVKVLPASVAGDAERQRRFEREARATSALDHPHVLSIHDVGTQDGTPYVVTELLEGTTLRERLGTPLPARRAVEYALQIAQGMAAAHEKGIIHRDLKPENVFVTRDGRIKILDFGLAKLTQPSFGGGSETDGSTMTRGTDPGTVLGTAGYMSPEQVRGQATDHRSDIFAFGAILYETLVGRRAFKGDTAADTMTAILKEEPPEISTTQPDVPLGLDRIVRHCLEKDAEARFQSARDLAFDLEAMSVTSAERVPRVEIGWGPGIRKGLAALALIAVGIAAGIVAEKRLAPSGYGSGAESLPTFHRLTYRRGTIRSARFAPDGQTIVYGAAWEGQPIRLFLTRVQGSESTPIALPDADILSISSSGEMALSLSRTFDLMLSQGTLARAQLLGGTPREVLENVREAEWTPDGSALAVVRRVGALERLEYPVDHVLYETGGYISHPRFSRQGDRIAFLDHPVWDDDRGWVSITDLTGHKTRLTQEYSSAEGLAWSRGGEDLWFSATKAGEANALRSVSLAGRESVVWRGPGSLRLLDVARDGRALVSETVERGDVFALLPGEPRERDLSWLGFTWAAGLSADGKQVLLTNADEPSGHDYAVYLRKTDGSPAVRLGEGFGQGLSPDGKWALAIVRSVPSALVLLPTGPGPARTLPNNGIEQDSAIWFPDGRRVLVTGTEAGHALRTYVEELDTGTAQPITPEGSLGRAVSPDGTRVVAQDKAGQAVIYPMDGGKPTPVPGLDRHDRILSWASDGGAFFVTRVGETPARIYRFDLATGRRASWRETWRWAPGPGCHFAMVRESGAPDSFWNEFPGTRCILVATPS